MSLGRHPFRECVGMPETYYPRRIPCDLGGSLRDRLPGQSVWSGKRLVSFGKHQARNGWREGGRSSLLESAQGATLLSVAMPAFQRQSNSLAKPHCEKNYHRKFIGGKSNPKGKFTGFSPEEEEHAMLRKTTCRAGKSAAAQGIG